MTRDPAPDIIRHFSGEGPGADIWHLLDLAVETGGYLNLGYSEWYQPHPVGQPQRRLAVHLTDVLDDRTGGLAGRRLLDLGAGRGGPAVTIAQRYGCRVLGVDLVPANVQRGRHLAADRAVAAEFVCGDGAMLPVRTGVVDAALAIDSLMYMPRVEAVLSELRRVLQSGWLVCSTLVRPSGLSRDERATLETFASAWDMAPIMPLAELREACTAAGLTVHTIRDISAKSIRRYRPWTRAGVGLMDAAAGTIEHGLDAIGLDGETILHQVRATHRALPLLQHVRIDARV